MENKYELDLLKVFNFTMQNRKSLLIKQSTQLHGTINEKKNIGKYIKCMVEQKSSLIDDANFE